MSREATTFGPVLAPGAADRQVRQEDRGPARLPEVLCAHLRRAGDDAGAAEPSRGSRCDE
jgi:hypothetical protein